MRKHLESILIIFTYIGIRWCWVRRWPWKEFQIQCASTGSSHQRIFLHRWIFLQYLRQYAKDETD
jgi:hypothetical protein